MPLPPIADRPLDKAIRTLKAISSADDLRFLAAYLTTQFDIGTFDRRGIGYKAYYERVENMVRAGRTDPITGVITHIKGLSEPDRATLRVVIDVLRDALQPVQEKARGTIQIKTVTRDYEQIDWETGERLEDEGGNPIYYTGVYRYVYVRIYAGKGDLDHDRAKLLSLYADRGMGRGTGGGGFVCAALDKELITTDDILDAWHAGKDEYQVFTDVCSSKLGISKPLPNLSASIENSNSPDKLAYRHKAKPKRKFDKPKE